jgi:hypothetical protein
MESHGIVVLGAAHKERTDSLHLNGREFTTGYVLFVDSRRRAAESVNANAFRITIPIQFQDVGCIELLQMMLPIPGAVGNETHALWRMTAQQERVERGATADNVWYTESIPLTDRTAAGVTTLKVTQSDLRPLKWRVPALGKLSLTLDFELLVWDPAITAYALYPFADDDFTDPLQNYNFSFEITAFKT